MPADEAPHSGRLLHVLSPPRASNICRLPGAAKPFGPWPECVSFGASMASKGQISAYACMHERAGQLHGSVSNTSHCHTGLLASTEPRPRLEAGRTRRRGDEWVA